MVIAAAVELAAVVGSTSHENCARDICGVDVRLRRGAQVALEEGKAQACRELGVMAPPRVLLGPAGDSRSAYPTAMPCAAPAPALAAPPPATATPPPPSSRAAPPTPTPVESARGRRRQWHEARARVPSERNEEHGGRDDGDMRPVSPSDCRLPPAAVVTPPFRRLSLPARSREGSREAMLVRNSRTH